METQPIKKPVKTDPRPQGYWAGLSILIVLFVVSSVNVGLSYPIFSNPRQLPGDWGFFFICTDFGVIAGLFGFLSLWFSLSPDGFWRRIGFLVFSATFLFALFFLVVLFHQRIDQSLSRSEDIMGTYVVAILIPYFAGAAIPLLVMRHGFGRILASSTHTVNVPQRTTVAGLMIATALVGLVFGAIQFATIPFVGDDPKGVWIAAGIGSGVACLVSLFSTVVATMTLLNGRLSFWPYFFLFNVYVIAFAVATYFFCGFMWGFDPTLIGLAYAIWLFGFLLSIACSALRLMGYRLTVIRGLSGK